MTKELLRVTKGILHKEIDIINTCIKGQLINKNISLNKTNAELNKKLYDSITQNLITSDRLYTKEKQSLILCLVFLLDHKIFDPIRLSVGIEVNDSPLITKLRTLYISLQGRQYKYIENIIHYKFQNDCFVPGYEVTRFVQPLVKAIYSGSEHELYCLADLSIPVKARILRFLKNLNLPFKSNNHKMSFFIDLLAMSNLEVNESTYIEFSRRIEKCTDKSIYEGRTTYFDGQNDVLGITDHPYLNYSSHKHYVRARYNLIDQYDELQSNFK